MKIICFACHYVEEGGSKKTWRRNCNSEYTFFFFFTEIKNTPLNVNLVNIFYFVT